MYVYFAKCIYIRYDKNSLAHQFKKLSHLLSLTHVHKRTHGAQINHHKRLCLASKLSLNYSRQFLVFIFYSLQHITMCSLSLSNDYSKIVAASTFNSSTRIFCLCFGKTQTSISILSHLFLSPSLSLSLFFSVYRVFFVWKKDRTSGYNRL